MAIARIKGEPTSFHSARLKLLPVLSCILEHATRYKSHQQEGAANMRRDLMTAETAFRQAAFPFVRLRRVS